jgi:hypothetical protein
LGEPREMRELAAWYRAFAEKAANPAIWEARLQTAEDLDQEADRIERRQRYANGPKQSRKHAYFP